METAERRKHEIIPGIHVYRVLLREAGRSGRAEEEEIRLMVCLRGSLQFTRENGRTVLLSQGELMIYGEKAFPFTYEVQGGSAVLCGLWLNWERLKLPEDREEAGKAVLPDREALSELMEKSVDLSRNYSKIVYRVVHIVQKDQ